MLLAKDRILGETMIRMVPTKLQVTSDFDPNHSLSSSSGSVDHEVISGPQLQHSIVAAAAAAADQSTTTFIDDFDLGLLPSSECDLDLDSALSTSPDSSLGDFSFSPPSPSDQACLSPNLTIDLDCSSLTMFSPDSACKTASAAAATTMTGIQANQQSFHALSPPCYVPTASPVSSPYTPPACHRIRFSSTDTAASSTSTASNLNLKEDLDELAELQRSLGKGSSQPSVLKRVLEEGNGLRLYPGAAGIKAEQEASESRPVAPAMEDTKLASVLSMVMDQLDMDLLEHVRKEIKCQSAMLNIHPDPTCWSQSEVARWLRHKMQELKIPSASCQPALQWAASFEGPGFVQITEEEFKARLPQGGDQIFSALDMWRNATHQEVPQQQQHQQSQPQEAREEFDIAYVLDMLDNTEQTTGCYSGSIQAPPPQYSEVAKNRQLQQPQQPPPSFEDHMAAVQQSSLNAPMPSIEELLHTEPVGAPPPYPGSSSSTTLASLQPPRSHSSSTHEMTEDEADEHDETDMSPATVPASTPRPAAGGGPIRGSSSNIHLWQFVKELLNQSQHSGCIHWVDRDQGIFKIVDSVRVAELWGKRKNRPAMNFDKLSRSLRQYYRKGIMKKTSRPQRLVYQFCAPYHL